MYLSDLMNFAVILTPSNQSEYPNSLMGSFVNKSTQKRTLRTLLICVISAPFVSIACGGGNDSPISPSSNSQQSNTGSTGIGLNEDEMWKLMGLVRSLQSSSFVSNALVKTTSGSALPGTTNGHGQFLFTDTSNHGNVQVEIEKSGFVTRSVYLPWSQSNTWNDVTMIEKNGTFDYDFWLQFVRNQKSNPGNFRRLWRWDDGSPNFYIRLADDDGTVNMSSTDRSVIESHLPRIVEHLTDGRLHVRSIEAGNLDRREKGWITIQMDDEKFKGNNFKGFALVGSNPGRIWLKLNSGGGCTISDKMNLRIFSHEVGHALGFSHIDNGLMMPSYSTPWTCQHWMPTSKERSHGGIAYQRERGNEHPDKAPSQAPSRLLDAPRIFAH